MHLNVQQAKALTSKTAQRGSMLVIALFVIIVLGLLGLAMTRLLSAASDTVVYEVLGQRALNAARSGINCALAEEFGAGCTQTIDYEFEGIAGLESCSYFVTPVSKTIEDGAKRFTFWTYTSKGQCIAGNLRVTRVVYVDYIVPVQEP